MSLLVGKIEKSHVLGEVPVDQAETILAALKDCRRQGVEAVLNPIIIRKTAGHLMSTHRPNHLRPRTTGTNAASACSISASLLERSW